MTYNLPHVKPWVQAAADEIGGRFGLKTIGGWRASDPFPDHPSGLALDLMISDMPNGHAVGQAIADYVQANAQRLGVKYEIWNRHSWNPQRNTWADYTSTDNPHTDHVHVTFLDKAPTGGGQIIGTAAAAPNDLVGAVNAAADAVKTAAAGVTSVGTLAQKMLWLALPTTQIRLAAGVIGCVLLFMGVATLGRQVKG